MDDDDARGLGASIAKKPERQRDLKSENRPPSQLSAAWEIVLKQQVHSVTQQSKLVGHSMGPFSHPRPPCVLDEGS